MSLPIFKLDEPQPYVEVPNRFTLYEDRRAIVALVRSVNATAMLEFGVNDGATAKLVLDNVRSVSTYKGVDVPSSYLPSLAVQREEVPRKPGDLVKDHPCFKLLVRPRGTLDLIPSDLGPCDVAFIDGDHGRAAVIHDTALARACVRSGGVIMWHDYPNSYCEVVGVLDGLQADGAPIFHAEGTWLAFERVP